MLTRTALTHLLHDIRNELSRLGYPPRRMILYGSYAKGGLRAHSDVDIAVWHEDFSGDSLPDLEKIRPIIRKFKSVDLRTYPAHATAANFDPFIEEIEKTGIEISTDTSSMNALL